MSGIKTIIILALTILACNQSRDSFIIYRDVPLTNETERKWTQGWLAVPENRKAVNSKTIELPFVYTRDTLERNSPIPILIMSGGPGNGSLHMANGSTHTPWAVERDLVVLDQRGTNRTIPSLSCPEIDSLIFKARSAGWCPDAIDEERIRGIRLCYERLRADHHDLNGYHTLESVEDLEDLRRHLDIPKWILYGMSYSCNLMTAYAQTYPERVEAVILDSPLPHHVDYDIEAFYNMDSVLRNTLESTGYSTELYDAWNTWVDTVSDSTWQIEINGRSYCYSPAYLIDMVVDGLSDHTSLSGVGSTIQQLISGDHSGIENRFGNEFRPSRQAKGMRFSVWTGEELSEEDRVLFEEERKKYPWLTDYELNDISFSTAEIWQVDPIYIQWHWPEHIYKGPVLILSGQMDPWTPEWYGQEMLRYVPNGRHLVFPMHSHLPGFTRDGMQEIADFISSLE